MHLTGTARTDDAGTTARADVDAVTMIEKGTNRIEGKENGPHSEVRWAGDTISGGVQ